MVTLVLTTNNESFAETKKQFKDFKVVLLKRSQEPETVRDKHIKQGNECFIYEYKSVDLTKVTRYRGVLFSSSGFNSSGKIHIKVE